MKYLVLLFMLHAFCDRANADRNSSSQNTIEDANAISISTQSPAQARSEDLKTPSTNLDLNPNLKSEEPSEEMGSGLLAPWSSAKKLAKKNGIGFELTYKFDTLTAIRNRTTSRSFFLGSMSLTLDFDLSEIFQLEGSSLIVHAVGNHGDKPSSFIGDSFVASNIEAPNNFLAYEVFFRKAIGQHSSLLLGLRDLNADFYSTESSKTLINSVFGISQSIAQSGVNGPSIFPVTAPAVSFSSQFSNSVYFQVAIFSAQAGNPDNPKGTFIANSLREGVLTISELGISTEEEGRFFKSAIGVWSYSKKTEAFDPELGAAQNKGVYAILDHSFSDQLSVFLKYGTASKQVNEFSSAAELGFNCKGVIGIRPEDHLAFGFSQAEASKDFLRLNTRSRAESVSELAYQIVVGPGITITPDYQYIQNPGLIKGAKPVEVVNLRIDLHF